ncbi:hypothetical protein LWI29_015081 [Acer saccharum]|uniref:RNase H type-1 domain-containing protein n=1 Tax=Acer saccharum TaxID=4024 RepID=A0AA39RW30_ACESA|nr:hypothetical protein LWI29_015081 [Acer saccharum]
MVIRDFEGCVVGSSTQSLAANFSPLVAEATALFGGIVFALEAGLHLLLLKLTLKWWWILFIGGVRLCSKVGIIISDIFQLIRIHEPRSAKLSFRCLLQKIFSYLKLALRLWSGWF